jgi:AAA15 family ATPase/GTPase
MIEDIEINNFRCFDRLKVSGFKRINLISGKNNVGKTALLESIFLNSMPVKDTIFSLLDLRRESIKFRKIPPQNMWDNLFFQQDLGSACSIDTTSDSKSTKTVEVFIYGLKEIFNATDVRLQILHRGLREWIGSEILEDDVRSNLLVISINTNKQEYFRTIIASNNHQYTTGAYTSDISNFNRTCLQNCLFIRSALVSSPSVILTEEFDKARLNDRDDQVLKAFQVIDSSIVAVESFSIGEPTIYLKRHGEKRLPLSLFGDAMNRVAEIILKIINNQDSVLLIDEIENGIHHSNQVRFWEILYKLAEQLNIQIFATTHSLEMTQAFIKAGLDQPNSAAHFELTRNVKTKKVVAISRDLETLEYGINHNKEVRGEA